MPIRPLIDETQAARNMAEIEPAYRPQEARVEAERCLYCFDAPCIHSCPTGIDVPSFIQKIATGNLTGAGRTILSANVLGQSCARVCPTEVLCEGACVLLDRDEHPIKIGRLQRFATDHVYRNRISVLRTPTRKSGKRVAIVGAGPAGLGCAAELAQLGHEAVVFEKKPLAGGLNTYGIAYYKMKPEVSLEEVDLVRSLGVAIRENTEIGRDVTPEELRADFDAIFLGVGLGRTRSLGIPGEDLPEVVEALEFIEQIHTRPLHEVPVGERVAVIGCGNTAIDAVTQARRLGARQATIVYRRGEAEMSAFDFEYELAKSDGVEFLFFAVPTRIVGDEHVEGLELARTGFDEEGNLAVIPDSTFQLACNMVIPSLGQESFREKLQALFPDLELTAKGVIVRDFATGRTNLDGVYAGGDAGNGGSEVVDAVAEGKRAARDMHLRFTGEAAPGAIQPSRHGTQDGPAEAGFDHPVRVIELEEAYAKDGRNDG